MQKLPKVKSSRIVHDGFYRLKEDQLELADGAVHSYLTLACTDAVAVVAQDEKGRWILNREYRHAAGEILLGCPGGRLEEGEDPISGGQREFFEETGYWFDEGVLIGCCHPFPSLCNQRIYYLFGKNAVKKGEQNLDPLERIDTILLPDDELKRLIQKGTPADGVLLTALWFKDHF